MILNLVRSVTSAVSLWAEKPFSDRWRSALAWQLAWKLTGRVGARRLGWRRDYDLALGAGLAVDNRDRHGARRFCRSRWRQGCRCGGRGGFGWGGSLRGRDDFPRLFCDAQVRGRPPPPLPPPKRFRAGAPSHQTPPTHAPGHR